MTIQSYKDLDVWKKSMDVVVDIYALTKSLPKEELYGLVSQMRRAAVSIPSNIAEGHAKRSTRDYIRYSGIAYGSIAELETQCILCERLDYLDRTALTPTYEALSSLGRMMNGLMAGLERKIVRSASPTPDSSPLTPDHD